MKKKIHWIDTLCTLCVKNYRQQKKKIFFVVSIDNAKREIDIGNIPERETQIYEENGQDQQIRSATNNNNGFFDDDDATKI